MGLLEDVKKLNEEIRLTLTDDATDISTEQLQLMAENAELDFIEAETLLVDAKGNYELARNQCMRLRGIYLRRKQQDAAKAV